MADDDLSDRYAKALAEKAEILKAWDQSITQTTTERQSIGEGLDPEVRADVVKAADMLRDELQERLEQQNQTIENLERKLYGERGLDPDEVEIEAAEVRPGEIRLDELTLTDPEVTVGDPLHDALKLDDNNFDPSEADLMAHKEWAVREIEKMTASHTPEVEPKPDPGRIKL